MVDEFNGLLDQYTQSIMRRFVDEKERYLLNFFGSYEKAQEVAHLYVFEEDDFKFETTENGMKIRYSYRIRPKTPEEMEAERAAKATLPLDEKDIHEWQEVQFSFGGWIECSCGFRPHNQADMDEHIPPKTKP